MHRGHETKSGFLVFTANRETDRQTTKYLKDPDAIVMMRLWCCAITELEFVIPAAYFTNDEKGPKRLYQMSKLTYSHEGSLWLLITWQYKQKYSSLPQQPLLLSE